MADNFGVKDASDDTKIMGTREIGGVHFVRHLTESVPSVGGTVTLATDLTTGSSSAIIVGTGAGQVSSGLYQLTIWGTPGTSSLKIEYSPDGGTTWIDTDVSDVTAEQVIGFILVAGRYRATVVDPGGGSSWSADLRGA